MMKLSRAAVAVLSVLLVLGPLTLSARTAEIGCSNISLHGDWQTIHAPTFAVGPADLTAYAVHPRLPNVIMVTNGEQVLVSRNFGCDWKTYFELELLPSLETPVSTANSKITHIDIPEHPSAADAVYLVIEERVGPAVRPHVIVKQGQDNRFRTAIDGGLPAVTGGVYGLHVAPSDPSVVYLHVRNNPAGLEDDIYASTDSGVNWQRRSTNSAGSQDMGIDPLNANDVWSWGVSGLWHSVDGGRSRSLLNSVGTPTPIVDIFHAPGAPARIMAYEAETLTFMVSHDGGASWTPISGPPGFARSIAHGNDSDDVIMAQHNRVDRFKAPGYWIELEPEYDQPDLAALTADRTANPSIYGLTPRSIEKYTGLNSEIDLPDIVQVDPTEIVDNTSLQPATTKMKLKAGGSREVDYRFDLPAHPKPLDVFFLVDTSDSMDSSISGLRKGMQNIAQSLADSKLDVWFGVGEIKDYPIPGYGNPVAGDFPYRLNRAVGPIDDSFEAALERLDASGGGTADYEESQLTGLYQAATGEGEAGCVDTGEDSQPCVPPGWGAGFRNESIKVIVNITDFGFHDQPQHPSPPWGTVANELNAQGIFQVGLAVWGTQGIKNAVADLTEMAEDTDTIAPKPVDCDGNGRADIETGEPLVCRVTDMIGSSVNLAPAIVATVRAIAEDVTVEIVTSDKKSVVDVAPALYPSVDITERTSLGFDLTFTCPRRLAGTTHNLTLAANVSGIPSATATAKVVCKKIPAAALVKRKKPPPPPPPVPVMPVFPPNPVAIPVLAPAGPPPVPETISSTQSAAQAQGAVAKQEQKQLQFAMAYAQFKNDEAYAFSSYTERSRPSVAPLYLSAVVMSLGAAFMALGRSRTRLSRAERRF